MLQIAETGKENFMPEIEDKVVVITGASSGIGEATALLLAERGAKLVLGARRADRLEALADRIGKEGGAAVYAPTNVKRRDDLTRLVKLACERYGKLDVLVNNAGIGPISPLDDLRVADWEEMIDVNIKGVLYGIAAALPVFRHQGFGHFVNIASTAGIVIKPTMAVYAGTKFAVRAITEGLRQEAGDKLRVTIISPGFVRTLRGIHDQSGGEGQDSRHNGRDGDRAGCDCPRYRPALTHMMHFKMSSSDKLKLPEIRFLTPQENQQLTDLAKDIARQMLGPDWKERQEQRRAALSAKTVQQ
jgi:NADP-dependent 3-hydroxy acid dehydrogenase YdfG